MHMCTVGSCQTQSCHIKLVEDLTGKKPEMGLVNPDTCVAIGAAIRAKQLMMDKDDQPAPSKELQ